MIQGVCLREARSIRRGRHLTRRVISRVKENFMQKTKFYIILNGGIFWLQQRERRRDTYIWMGKGDGTCDITE
jgi:hypothetical protein